MTGCNQSQSNLPILDTKPPARQYSTPTNEIKFTSEPTTNSIPAPSGLIYCSDDKLYAVREDGSRMLIIPDCWHIFSPDYQHILFEDMGEYYILDLTSGELPQELVFWDQDNDPQGLSAERIYGATWSTDNKILYFNFGQYGDQLTDIWSLDFITGEMTNLTNTDNRVEGWPRLLDGQKMLVFSSHNPESDYIHPYFFGYLTTMNIDGSDYKLLSTEKENGNFRVSPHGTDAAIFGGMLYGLDQGLHNFYYTNDSQINDINLKLIEPSWSPNNKYIAWSLYNMHETNGWTGIGLFELERTH